MTAYAGERASFGVFAKTLNAIGKQNFFEFLKRLSAQTGVGAIQESATQAMNLITDMVVMGKGWGSNTKSQMTAYFDNYLKEHPEAKNNQAFWATVVEALRQIGLAGGGGALSGFVLGGVSSAIQNFRNKSNPTLTPAQAGTYNQGNEGAGDVINPNEIRFSQSSVNGVDEITTSMKANGWQGEPIDVVKMPDGKFSTLDNTRVVAARQAGINVKANVHGYNDPLPSSLIKRFTTPKGVPETWGDALNLRIGKQNSTFRHTYPSGSFDLPKINNK